MTTLFQPVGSAAPAAGALIVHASESWMSAIARGDFDFFEKLGARARSEGAQTYLVPAETPESRGLLAERHVHIMVGPRHAISGSALFAMPSYIWGFWYFDPRGINWHSSLADQPFKPDSIDRDKATYFFNGVSGYMLRENVSKFPQSDLSPALDRAKAVIFLQDIEKYKSPVHHLSSDQMIRFAATGTRDGIYVKFHPMQSQESQRRFKKSFQRYDNVQVSDRSIHDLSAVSEIVITQNSAAGFEALMQKKPVITCARTDYHHATRVVTTARQMVDALDTAIATQSTFPFEQYFYWFMGLNMLEPQKGDFADRAWSRIEAFKRTL